MRRRPYECLLAVALCVAIIATGLRIVSAKHEARQLFAELEALNREQDRLEVDWGRLRLEQSTHATHPRIEQLARSKLNLGEPQSEQLVVIAGARP